MKDNDVAPYNMVYLFRSHLRYEVEFEGQWLVKSTSQVWGDVYSHFLFLWIRSPFRTIETYRDAL